VNFLFSLFPLLLSPHVEKVLPFFSNSQTNIFSKNVRTYIVDYFQKGEVFDMQFRIRTTITAMPMVLSANTLYFVASYIPGFVSFSIPLSDSLYKKSIYCGATHS
jgi:hypothetical protein